MSSERKRESSCPPSGDDLEHLLAGEREALKALFPLPPAGTMQTALKRSRARRGKQAAVLAVALAVATFWADPAYRTESYETRIGERRTVALADGSRLTLDTATRVTVSWHLRSRRSTLEAGRVSYAVAPAVLRPFDVSAAALDIRVVGTVFDVRRDAHETSVTVREGRVRVTAPEQAEALLTPGERIQFATDADGGAAALRLGHVDPAAAAAWADGRLAFERTPLSAALAEVGRYHAAPIRLHGEHLGELQVSGVFDSARSDQFLALLPRILPLRVSRAADGGVDVEPR